MHTKHKEEDFLSKKEFRVENEYSYNRNGPVRWILSQVLRYPWLPLLVTVASIVNNFAASYVQVFIGRSFDLISVPGWQTSAVGSCPGGFWCGIGAKRAGSYPQLRQ